LNSNRFAVEFQERRAFGVTEPRLKMSCASSASTETLSELIVNEFEAVPEMVVDAALMLFTLIVSK